MDVALVQGREARGALPALLTIAAGRQHTAETILRAWFEGKSDHTNPQLSTRSRCRLNGV
jgi:hypothetical protein